MKTIVILAVLIVSIAALPPLEDTTSVDVRNLDHDTRLITGSIVKAIEAACESIRDAGLDPLYIAKYNVSYALPVPVIFNSAASVLQLLSTGLSNVVIHRMNYAVITSRLTFDLEIPLINLQAEHAAAEATLFGSKLDIKASGSIVVRSIRIVGTIRVNISVISGITVRSITITFTLGGIDSNVTLVIQGKNFSDKTNKFIGSTIPKTLKEYSNEINELLEIILLDIINANLN